VRIRDVMTRNPITVDSETLILDAMRVMKEKNVRRLPVVDGGKLVGIVTQKDLNEAVPAPTTTTSAYEFHYFLAKMKVKEVMKKDPLTFSPDAPFEEALRVIKRKRISSFLVVENGKLVGIMTESDLVRFLVGVLGLEEEGSRITVEGWGGKLGGKLQQVISILDKHRAVLLSMLSLPRPEKHDWVVVFHINIKEPTPVVDDLTKAGLNVTYVG
jgi:acetoin utilization protein AcuB